MSLALQAAPVEADTLFGRRTIDPAHIVHFPQGLRGLERYTQWILIAAERPHAAWLQSLDAPELALLLVDPFEAFPGYAVDLPPAALSSLGADGADGAAPVAVFAPVTLGGSEAPATANLRGPVVINMKGRLGTQCVVDAPEWSVRQAIPAEVLA